MRICSITATAAGELELRVYAINHSAASAGRKSSAVTAPAVISLMRRKCSTRGILWPAMYRVIATWLTPTVAAKSARDMPLSARKSASFIRAAYQAGTKAQVNCTSLVWDIQDGFQYHIGMSGLTKARIDKGLSRKELGDKVGRSETSIGRYETGSRRLSDKLASILAAELGVSPVEIKADFSKDSMAGLSAEGKRLLLENLKMIYAAEGARRKSG